MQTLDLSVFINSLKVYKSKFLCVFSNFSVEYCLDITDLGIPNIFIEIDNHFIYLFHFIFVIHFIITQYSVFVSV